MADKYPHDALVRAWLDGKVIQYLDADGVWIDIDGPDKANKLPHLYRDRDDYRIKPVTIRYRVALLGNGCVKTVNNLMEERVTLDSGLLERWLTDWTEVVV